MKFERRDSDSGVEDTRYRPGRLALRWLPYLLILLPAALSLAFVGAFGVNVVVRDQWEMVRLFAELASGTLSFGDLWATHNEHQFFFPRIAMLVLGTLSDWNNLAEMYLIQVCLLVTLAILFLAFRRDVGSNRPFLFVPVAFLILSFRQWSNMLWGYQLTFALTLLSSVLSLFFLRTATLAWQAGRRGSGGAAFVAALSGATVAAGSSIQGLLVWPAGLLPLLAARLTASEKAVFTGIWTSAGVGVWSAYFLGYEAHLGSDSSLPNPLADPALGVGFFLSLLGNSLTSRPGGALACGLLLVVLAAAVAILARRARTVADYSFWLSLVALSFLILLAITAGRGGGTEGALASRYTTFSLIAVASLYVA
ncbi:MAG: hypothetical protein ACRDTR_16710, partial [Rubrobacter sp.]